MNASEMMEASGNEQPSQGFKILINILSYSKEIACCSRNFVHPSTNIFQIVQTKLISVSLIGDDAAATAPAPVRVVPAPPPAKPRQGQITTFAELYCGICEVYGSSPQNIIDHVNGQFVSRFQKKLEKSTFIPT